MSGKQHAVMWLGIVLIIVRLFTTNQWSILWSTFTTNPNPGGPGNTPSNNMGSIPSKIGNALQNVAGITPKLGPLGFIDLGAHALADNIVKHL